MKPLFDCARDSPTVPLLATNGDPSVSRTALAARLRQHLADAVQRLATGSADVRHPGLQGDLLPRSSGHIPGHFHLAGELFIQLSGWTEFQFARDTLRLSTGEILLVPPRLLHHERVGADTDGRPFENLVIYAEDGAYRCHLAQEAASGIPGILFLDMGRHAQATLVEDWLAGAARAVEDGAATKPAPTDSSEPESPHPDWAVIQSRALVVAALTGILSALDDPQQNPPAEPMPVSRLRVMVQNQLGDHTLSVRSLAEQTDYTADYLSNLFSTTTGEHLSAYINRLRLERAAHLLRESTLAGKEIAWACGFSSPSYFIRAFRAHYGQTPKSWRAARP